MASRQTPEPRSRLGVAGDSQRKTFSPSSLAACGEQANSFTFPFRGRLIRNWKCDWAVKTHQPDPAIFDMHTQISLTDLGRLVDGHLENPSSILGPHPVDYRGTKATAVRSFLPEAQSAWIIDSASGRRRPMRKLHPAGFFEV